MGGGGAREDAEEEEDEEDEEAPGTLGLVDSSSAYFVFLTLVLESFPFSGSELSMEKKFFMMVSLCVRVVEGGEGGRGGVC